MAVIAAFPLLPDGHGMCAAMSRRSERPRLAAQRMRRGEPRRIRWKGVGDVVKMLKRFGRNESGQDLAEYAIALAVITVGVIVAVQIVGTRVRTIWQNVATTIQQAS
jgi:Flp pilus assembly pilin Flp